MGVVLYIEKGIQLDAVAYLTSCFGYRELFSDAEATGARIDSAGLLAGRLHLIEVKPVIASNIVEHRDDRPGSLESKIAGALRQLYRGEPGPGRTLAAAWTRETRPVIGFIAGRCTEDGRAALQAVLERRAPEWAFDYRVWHWRDGRLDELFGADHPEPMSPTAYDSISVPHLIGRRARASAPALADLRRLASERGVAALFDALLAGIVNRRLAVKRTQSGVSVHRRQKAGVLSPALLGAYLPPSRQGALNVGFVPEWLGLDGAQLPGSPAPRAGFMNTNRFVTDPSDLELLLDRLRSAVITT